MHRMATVDTASDIVGELLTNARVRTYTEADYLKYLQRGHSEEDRAS